MTLDRNRIPVPSLGLEFKIPEFTHLKSKEGLKVSYIHKSKLPLVHVNLLIHAGGKYDPEGKTGLAHLMSRVIDEGAGEYDALELNAEIEKLGSVIHVSCSKDYIKFSLLSLTDKFERTFELMTKILKEPHFDEIDFNKEKRKTLVNLVQLKDMTDETAEKVFFKVLYPETHPYGKYTMGSEASVNRIEINDVIDFYKTSIYKNNIFISAAAGMQDDDFMEIIDKHLGGIPDAGGNSKPDYSVEYFPQKLYIVNKPDAVQTEIRVGHITGQKSDPDYFHKVVMNQILGGQFSSRLNLNLREDKGFTYGVRSGFYYNREGGAFRISTSVASDNTGSTLNEIIKEMESIKIQAYAEEINFAKVGLIRKFPTFFETYEQLTNNLNMLHIYGLADNYFDTYLQNIDAVSQSGVLEAANNNLFTDKAQIVLAGNAEKIRENIAKYYSGDIVETDTEGNLL